MIDIEHLWNLLVQVMLPVSLLVAAGGYWKQWFPQTDTVALRNQLSQLTLYLTYPSVLFSVALSTPITDDLLVVPLVTALAAFAGGALAWLIFYRTAWGRRLPAGTRAVLLIGAMFGNTFNVGVPVLSFLHGPDALRYAVFNDMLMVMPLVWSVGVWIATRLGEPGGPREANVLRVMLSMPPIWAFIAGATLRQAGFEYPPLVDAARMIGQPTIPVMLFVVGLTIPWRDLAPRREVLVATAIKLAVVPVAAWLFGLLLFGAPAAASASVAAAAVLSSVPTMLTLLVLAERFRLDAPAAALLIGWSTIFFWLTLPLLMSLGVLR